MAKRKIRIILSYDGSHFRGWQRQKDFRDTLQEILENALCKLVGRPIPLYASSRTDAGVSARVQVVHTALPIKFLRVHENERYLLSSVRDLNPRLVEIEKALNLALPQAIRIHRIERVRRSFHASRDARLKTYLYFCGGRDSCKKLNVVAMNRAATMLIGLHDFKAFASPGGANPNMLTRRKIMEARFDYNDEGVLIFRITGNGFLKHMVRNILGVLFSVGSGVHPPSVVADILSGKTLRIGFKQADPSGLWLWDIVYDPKNVEMDGSGI